MSFAQNLIPRIFHKEDEMRRQLKRVNLYTDGFDNKGVVAAGLQIFHGLQRHGHQQQGIKSLIRLMEQKTTYSRKLKLLLLIVQITKQTKYDIADILISKKLRLFTKSSSLVSKLPSKLDKSSLQQYVYVELLVPLYNYMMKLSVNEELFNTCRKKEIPQDQIFRRGMKIRFIWIFKLYNLIHTLLPILQKVITFINTFKYLFFQQMAQYLYSDILIMNNFILKAIDEAAEDNYILMPYFDMLQFYQSLTEQIQTSKKIIHLYEKLKQHIEGLQKPMQLTLTKEEIEEIEVQALRVKLICNTLKNPKKDHTRLQTEYNTKSEYRQQINKKHASFTEGNQLYMNASEDIQAVKQKFKNLEDQKSNLNHSLEQVSDEQESEQDEKEEKIK